MNDIQSHSDFLGLSGGKRYGFQGQEEDYEIWGGAISFKYRIEDAQLGRFFSLDPLHSDYPRNSPFAFCENEVISFIELEGLERSKIKVKRSEPLSNKNFQGGELVKKLGFLRGIYTRNLVRDGKRASSLEGMPTERVVRIDVHNRVQKVPMETEDGSLLFQRVPVTSSKGQLSVSFDPSVDAAGANVLTRYEIGIINSVGERQVLSEFSSSESGEVNIDFDLKKGEQLYQTINTTGEGGKTEFKAIRSLTKKEESLIKKGKAEVYDSSESDN